MENLDVWMNRLRDPSYDVSEDGFHVIDIAKRIYDNPERYPYTEEQITDFIEMVMLRVVQSSPTVFAISVGQFPYLDKIEEYWREFGLIDPDGFRWLRKKY